MRRKVPLSSLTVGRCFAYHGEEPAFEEGAASTHIVHSVMTPDSVWKITMPGAEEIVAENALGDSKAFEPALMVAEIPRGGFDRLVERVADPGDTAGGAG